MAEIQTKVNEASVEEFLSKVEDEQKRKDCFEIVKIPDFAEMTRKPDFGRKNRIPLLPRKRSKHLCCIQKFCLNLRVYEGV